MFYDLHIHSCLSPCASDDMTPNNIVNMAILNGLQLISVTDHNSLRQQKSIASVAAKNGIGYIYGVEIQTMEEVHCLAYFQDIQEVEKFQLWIDSKLMVIPNDENYFGHQWIMDEQDEIIAKEERLLLSSLDATLEQCVQAIHEHKGKAVLAHVLDRANSVCTQLGFIPMDLKYDGLEIKKIEDKEAVLNRHPWIKDPIWLCNSDAHQLIDLHEQEFNAHTRLLEMLEVDDL